MVRDAKLRFAPHHEVIVRIRFSNSRSCSRAPKEPSYRSAPARLALAPFAPSKRGRRGRRDLPVPMTACTRSALGVYAIRANNKQCRRVVVTGAGEIPASRSARGACPIRADSAQWVTACFAWSPVDLPFIHRWRIFSALRLRVGTRPHKAARGRSCDERQARRNPATSAAANPRARNAKPCGHRPRSAREPRERSAPLVDRGETAITRAGEAGISFCRPR
jgi:hypothetical protein